MKHYIIIRFNYPKDYIHIKDRIDLFNQLTYPSLINQTEKNFKVLIIGHPDIKLPHLNHAFLDFKQHSAVKDFDINPVKQFIFADLGSEKRLITSRLDNDDILLPDYVKTIQKLAAGSDLNQLIETKGYFFDIRTQKLYISNRYSKDVTSPFSSLSERSVNFNTVFRAKHSSMGKYYPVLFSKIFGWIQVIHKHNQMMNRLKISQMGIETGLSALPDLLREDSDWMNYYSGDYL